MDEVGRDLGLQSSASKLGELLARVLIWFLLGVLTVTLLVFYIFFTPLQVVGDSMMPNLHTGDRALRTKGYGTPARGDIIVIDVIAASGEEDIVKRVIGVPGDTVEIKDDQAIVNGTAEDVSGIARIPGSGDNRAPLVVPQDSVYVLGDNRPVSLDSRYVGPLKIHSIRGKVSFLFLPLARVRALH